MNRFIIAAAMVAAPLTAVPFTAAVAQAPLSATSFVAKAGASDQYEIQSSRLVLASTGNRKLRRFATMMVADHTKSTAEVKAAAARSHVHAAPPMLDAQGRRDVAALRAAHGTGRDALYVRQQKAAHQRALALHQSYAARGSAAPLKTVAAHVVPVVRTHIRELATM